MLKHLGLFEGIGGFSLAARWMGWQTVAWCEWNPFCQQVLRYHFPKAEGHGDITKTDFTKYANRIDILTGGFPCQPFSVAGKQLGTEDERYLWKEMLRAIREIQPPYVVAENVSGLVNWNGGLVFDTVQADLEAEGYEVIPFLLPAAGVNAPHKRERVWFIANSDGAKQGCNYRTNISKKGKVWKAETSNVFRELFGNGNAANTDTSGLSFGLQPGAGQVGRTNATCEGCKSARTHTAPSWKQFPTQSPLCSRNDGLPSRLAGITFSKHRNESLKAYGNAIVPQVAYEIFKAIQTLEITHSCHQ